MKKLFLFLTLFALTFSLNNVANATFCSLLDVTCSDQCLDGTPSSNNILGDLNSLNYFDYSDWEYLSKVETPGDGSAEGLVNIGLVVLPTGESNSGTWSFNPNTWNTYENIIIVLKDGGVGEDNIKWFAYLLENRCSFGNWTYPEGKDLSHLSVYGRSGDVPVPEPATILLLGSGLVGLAGFGRKKFKK